jgi:hypothetical protein
MSCFRILTAAALAASAVAISPSIAQDRGGHAMGGAGVAAPNAGATAGTAHASVGSVAHANFSANAHANMRTSQMPAGPRAGTPGGTWQGNRWNGGPANNRVAANTWNGNWNGRSWDRDHDHRFHRGPGVAFGFGFGQTYAPYDDYAYDNYPYDTYAYDYPAYSDSYAYDDGNTAVVTDNGNDQAYCMQRYRSYDPASGTFLGYDGFRHPCP